MSKLAHKIHVNQGEKNKLEKDKGEKADKNKAEKGKADKNKGEKKVRKLHYERELTKLQRELVKLQEWVRQKGLKVVVLFEGRDAAGKGGAIKRITECLNPRICRVVALGTDEENIRSI